MTTRLVRTLPVALLALALAGPASAAVINGTDGPDTLVGTPQADTIRGHGGLDKIYGKAGSDRLFAGRDSARDRVYAGRGNDRVRIWLGDTVYARRGNDVIRLYPTMQKASALASGDFKWTRVYCGPGYDRLYTFGDYTGAAEPDDGNDWLVIWRGCEEVH